jgi:hypothetical protein
MNLEDVTVGQIVDILFEKSSRKKNKNLLLKLYDHITAADTEDQLYDKLTRTFSNKKGLNLSDKIAKYIISQAIYYRCYDSLRSLLLDKGNRIKFSKLGKKGNLIKTIDTFGFPEQFVLDIWNIKDQRNGTTIGSGEIFMNLILDEGNCPSRGDVMIGEDLKVELKVTNKSTSKQETAFRLKGQAGYGSGNRSGLHVFIEMVGLYEKVNKVLPAKKKITAPDPILGATSQLYLKSSETIANGYFKTLVSACTGTKYEDTILESIKQVYVDSLKMTYNYATDEDLCNVIGPSLRSDGTLDLDKFFSKHMTFEFKYYQSVENWPILLCINSKYDYIVITKEDITEDFISENFTVVNPLNTKSTATQQDSLCGIKLNFKS